MTPSVKLRMEFHSLCLYNVRWRQKVQICEVKIEIEDGISLFGSLVRHKSILMLTENYNYFFSHEVKIDWSPKESLQEYKRHTSSESINSRYKSKSFPNSNQMPSRQRECKSSSLGLYDLYKAQTWDSSSTGTEPVAVLPKCQTSNLMSVIKVKACAFRIWSSLLGGWKGEQDSNSTSHSKLHQLQITGLFFYCKAPTLQAQTRATNLPK